MTRAWARERPRLDLEAIGVVTRVLRLAHYFDQAQEAELADLGLRPGWLDVLAALRRSGSPHRLSPTALSGSVLLTSGGMTSRLDRLEEAGLVRRVPDPGDRRGVLVELTPEGRRITDAAMDGYRDLAERLLQPLPSRERGSLADAMRRLLAALEHPEHAEVAPDDAGRQAKDEARLSASWIPSGAGRASPRESARRGRRPRAGRREPSR
jgi:DNA-binding MarR family transcriptional regulator